MRWGPAVMLLVLATAAAAGPAATIDGARAWRDLERIVGFGPRPSGSAALERTREYIVAELRRAGVTTRRQSFTAQTAVGPIAMANLIAEIPGVRRDVIVLGGHYDTKYYHDVRFVGANDGGSGTALLLELARALSERAREYSVWIVFFDGEEDRPPTSNNAALHGSVHFVQEAARTGDLGRLRAAVILDMVGDRDLDVHPDAGSTEWLNAILWTTARHLGHGRHFPDDAVGIIDDHVPLLRAGVSAALVIDHQYGPAGREFWHTPQDTLDKVSSASLQIVGDVVLQAIPEIERTLQTQGTLGPRRP